MHGNHDIVRAGFKPALTKNKKDMGKILHQKKKKLKSISDNLNTNQQREARG